MAVVVQAARRLLITMDTFKGTRTYLLEWPKCCQVTALEFVEGATIAEDVDDLTTCDNCVHHNVSCFHVGGLKIEEVRDNDR